MRGLFALVILAGCAASAVDPSDATTETVDTAPDAVEPHDLDVNIGQRATGGDFAPLTEGQPIEIETLGQPGPVFHLEVDFEVAPPPGYLLETMKLWVEATTTEPPDGPSVGHFLNKKVIAFPQPPEAPVFRPHVPAYVIFDEGNADLYAGKACAITLRVGLYLPGEKLPTLWTTVRKSLYCVNLT